MLPQLVEEIAKERAAFAVTHKDLLQQIIVLAERVRAADETLPAKL